MSKDNLPVAGVFTPNKPFSRFPGLRWSPEGEVREFMSEADVPEGWLDRHPHHDGAPPAAEEEIDVQAGDVPVTLKRKDIIIALKRRRIPFKASAKTEELYALLETPPAPEGEQKE